jgi:tRNA (guanine37-N1)-methyltransferase
MRTITFISVQPELIASYCAFGVFRRAQAQGQIAIKNINLRDFAIDRHGSIDARPYGGGDGMVMRPEPLAAAVEAVRRQAEIPPLVILPSPQGQLWRQQTAGELQTTGRDLILICGRFGGVDQRFIDRYVDYEFSLGDFVISGGELAALAMVDSLLRLEPGILGHQDSAAEDSFGAALNGGLEYPLYTKPEVFEGETVPPVLLSGDHKAIATWRREQAEAVTRRKRPDLARS